MNNYSMMNHISSITRNPRREFDNLREAGFFPWGGIGESKAPYGNGWQRFGQERPTDAQTDDLLGMNPTHVGIILPYREIALEGTMRITVFDCECEEVGDEVLELIREICPELENKIAIRRNRNSGGAHVFVQHPVDTPFPKVRLYDRNIKLKKPGHENDAESDKAPLIFEILGADKGAKYCIVFADGREYVSEVRLEDLETLTPSETKALETVLERLAERYPTESKVATKNPVKRKTVRRSGGDLDFDDLDANIDVCELLEKEEWKLDSEDDERWYFTRPGKDSGTSVSVLKENQLLHVFTSSTDFEEGETYTPFQVYALLEHGVNKGATIKSLSKP